jgi:hypothetical protein
MTRLPILKSLAELTDDDYELQALVEPHQDYVTPDDPYYQEIQSLATEIGYYAKRIGKAHRAPALYLQGKTRQDIAEQINCAYQTVCNTLNSKDGRRMLALLQRAAIMEQGPSIAARQSMLWRIAVRNERDKPSISISAVDTLNKQQGLYIKDDNSNQVPTIVVQNFQLPATPDYQQQTNEKDITPDTFQGVTIEVPDDPDNDT